MENLDTKFRGQVLNKVYRVWLLRKFLPIFLIEIVILSAALYQFSRLVFIEKVLGNFFRIFFQDPSGSLVFVFSSFGKTPTVTKVLTVAVVILAALLLRMLTQGVLRLILVRKNYFGKAGQRV